MSQNLESPGFADAKMDISSEATSQSQESPGVISPDDDGEPFQQRDLTTLSNEETDDAQRYSCGVPKSRSYTRNVISGSPVSSLFDNNLHEDATREDCAEQSTDSARPKHKIVLPDGRMREIDMKVIEPYKRVLSHGGYLKTAGHNAIIIFSACYLPDRSRMDYHYVMDNLFLYVVQTLEQLVTDDYVMIYLHGGCCKNNVPPFHWLRKCYQLLDRRLRKSLKTLYMVHPTFWLKSLVIMSRPFISSKFWRKFIYVKNLEDLYEMVPVEKAAIPEKVKQFNSRAT
uniref:CRAL-TRIO domain-containing protein n=2 Tax=Lutzomyia longipalpis TaxID=7200 RepID=A0A1B0CL67_LUTLO